MGRRQRDARIRQSGNLLHGTSLTVATRDDRRESRRGGSYDDRCTLGAIPRLRRYARTLVFDAHAADDVVQATLERALTHWHRFDQSRDILVWLMSIAHNAHIDELRRSARLRPASETEQEGLASLPGAPSSDPALRLDLLAALRRLPAEQREPLLLVTLEQFSYAECAQILRIPIGTVMSRISRGRRALYERLHAERSGEAGTETVKGRADGKQKADVV